MNAFLSGGHVQGILTTLPAAFVIPSQSPVPVGFTPGWTPNWGTSAGSTPRFTGAAIVVAMSEMAQSQVESVNFIVDGPKKKVFKEWWIQRIVASSLKECLIRPTRASHDAYMGSAEMSTWSIRE